MSRVIKSILGLSILSIATPMVAQDSSLALEEIVVTAERRAQSLQDTPAAITAVTGETLEAASINNLNEFTLTTPGISISGISRNQQYISMRGNITEAGEAGAAQSIGFFIDGLYYGRSSLFNQSLADVERVEVLRGPQGTLWGHNIVGGSINVITRDPTQETEISLKATAASHGRREVSGRIAGGLTESIAGQITFSSESSDGYVTNLDSGQELGSEDVALVRAKLIWDINDRLSAKISASRQEDTSGMNARNYVPGPTAIITPPPPGTTAPVLAAFDVPANFETETHMGTAFGTNDITSDSLSLQLKYEFDNGLTFTSLTGQVDSGGDVNNFSFFPIPDSHGNLRRSTTYSDESFSQEFHLAGGSDSSLFWQVGAYYYDATNSQDATDMAWGLPFTRGGANNFADMQGNNNRQVEWDTLDRAETESTALFGQATWSATDWLDLTVGLRYSDVEKSGTFLRQGEAHARNFSDQAADCSATPPVFCSISRSVGDSWTNTSPKIIVDGHWDDVGPFASLMVYGTYSEGWKEGGFQTPSSSTAPVSVFSIAPESATNNEIGFKTTFWDGRATLNGALFNTEYDGQQTVVFVGTQLNIFNLDSEIDGIELDGQVALTDWLSVNYAAAFYDSEYLPGAALGPNPGDSVAGNPTVGTPETSWTIGWDAHTMVTENLELFFRGSYSVASEIESDPDAPLAASEAFGRTLLPFTESKNLNATLGIRNDNWELSIWGRNLTDEFVMTNMASFTDFWVLNAWNADNDAIEVFEGVRTEPRTIGVSLAWNF